MNLSRSLLIGLIVSAALNVFLIGGVAGVVWVRQTTPAPVRPSPVMAAAEPPQASMPDDVSPPQKPQALPRPRVSGVPAQAEAGVRPPLWTAGQGLSPQSRLALRQTLRDANKRNQPVTRQARAERQAALDAMKAKPYDPAEVGKRLANARALDIQARGNVEIALANYAATLSADERAALADGLARVYAPRKRPLRAGSE